MGKFSQNYIFRQKTKCRSEEQPLDLLKIAWISHDIKHNSQDIMKQIFLSLGWLHVINRTVPIKTSRYLCYLEL